MMGETGKSHPRLSHPLERVFLLAKDTGLDPQQVRRWDADEFEEYWDWWFGYNRGESIRRSR